VVLGLKLWSVRRKRWRVVSGVRAQRFHALLRPAASGYVLKLMSAFDVIAALLLLSGRFVPLALALLTTILVNIIAFHLALDMGGIGFGGLLALMVCFLAWGYRGAFRPMLASNARPG
jgi:hypothetical protein